MKAHRGLSARTAARAEQGLYRAILSLRNEARVRTVLRRPLHTRGARGARRSLGGREVSAGRPALSQDSRPHGRLGDDDRPCRTIPHRRQRRLPSRAEAPEPALTRGDIVMRVTTESRIKIAVQKSGRLTDHSLELLVRCGLSYSRGKDQLICFGENMPVDVLLVRDDDIPRLVQEDICDLGIVGMNIIEERRLEMIEQGKTELFTGNRPPRFRPVPAVVRRARRRALRRRRSRSTASASRPLIRESSRTFCSASWSERADHLVLGCRRDRAEPRQGGPHLRSRVERLDAARAPALRGRDDPREPRGADPDAGGSRAEKAQWLQRLLQRIQGVLQVKESKYIMLHAPRSALKEIRALLPGSESPTIIPLEGRDDKVAVHAVCRENVFWETLEQLKEAGASSMLVLARREDAVVATSRCSAVWNNLGAGRATRVACAPRARERRRCSPSSVADDRRASAERRRRCARRRSPRMLDGVALDSLEVSDDRVRGGRSAPRRARNVPRSARRPRTSRRSTARSSRADRCRTRRPGVRCERVSSADRERRALCARRQRPAAVHCAHARSTGAAGRLRDARALQPRAGDGTRRRRPCSMRRAWPACSACSSSAARKPLPRSLRHGDGAESRQDFRPRQHLGHGGEGASGSRSRRAPRATTPRARPRCS